MTWPEILPDWGPKIFDIGIYLNQSLTFLTLVKSLKGNPFLGNPKRPLKAFRAFSSAQGVLRGVSSSFSIFKYKKILWFRVIRFSRRQFQIHRFHNPVILQYGLTFCVWHFFEVLQKHSAIKKTHLRNVEWKSFLKNICHLTYHKSYFDVIINSILVSGVFYGNRV